MAVALVVVACTTSQEAREPAVAAQQGLPLINHLVPARDSVGERPARFEWTAAKGADRYAIGIWSEVDRLMWRADDVRDTSVALPDDVELEFGTYYWSVTGLDGNRVVAESGLSAFVVLK